MREVLFRGKRTDNGEWVYGYCTKARYFLNKKEMHIIFEPDVEAFSRCEFTGYEEVLSETVGQYTGLTDKNGVKIFEGDILKAFGYIYVIMWDSIRAMFYLRDPVYRVRSDFYYYFGSDLSVIGNIHDNPDILKGGGDNG